MVAEHYDDKTDLRMDKVTIQPTEEEIDRMMRMELLGLREILQEAEQEKIEELQRLEKIKQVLR